VVTADRSAMAEIAGGAAVLVDPAEPMSIADGTERLLLDVDRRAELVAAGRLRAEAFDWAASARATAAVLATAADLSVAADAEHRV
jgi:glycosyltransferase involved in cell wall biosynthesis